MASLYAMYIKEREGKEIVESENGFATYQIFPTGECYIQDIFVVPEMRKSGLTAIMQSKIADIAKTKGCHTLLGSVCMNTPDANRNLKILLNDGWMVHNMVSDMIYLNKKLEGVI
jgi:hypothetical protein